MNDSRRVVGLVVCGNTDTEWQAIRSVLENFGMRVVTYLIGRPNDFIDVVNGASLYADIDHLIISAHGEDGAILLPELAPECYVPNEPTTTRFDASLVEKYGCLSNRFVLTTGCTLGDKQLADAFLKIGCSRYVAPDGYVEASAALLFVIRFYYELMVNARSETDAFQIAQGMDGETELFKMYA